MGLKRIRLVLIATVFAAFATMTSAQTPPEDTTPIPAPDAQDAARPDYSVIFGPGRRPAAVQPNVADQGTRGDVFMTAPAP